MTRGANPRRANGYRRDTLRRMVKAQGAPCWLCGYAIDYALPWSDERSFVLDEKLPVKYGGSPVDPDNVAPAHRCCNGWRGAKRATPRLKAEIRARYASKHLGARPKTKKTMEHTRNWGI